MRCTAIALAAAGILQGCSTPQAAMDQANNTVQLVQSLQNEMTRYQTTVKLSAERRLASVQQTDVGALEIAREQQFDSYLTAKSGMSDVVAARDRLRDASDTYSKILADHDKAQEELAARLAAIAKDLPTPTEKINAVQKAMAELGTELPAKERVAIVTTFFQQAKCIWDKSTEAAASAASPPAASASAPATSASAPAGCTTAEPKKEGT